MKVTAKSFIFRVVASHLMTVSEKFHGRRLGSSLPKLELAGTQQDQGAGALVGNARRGQARFEQG